jgi:glycolate oxidase subunit GlcD
MQALKDLNLFLSAEQIKTDSGSLQHYGKDWTTYFDISASAVLFPRATTEVKKIVQWALKHKIGLVPSGGRTGLSGGACALNGEVVVSFEKMNQIFDFDPIDQTVKCQAGVVTEALQNFAVEKSLLYPVDFAARGSSHLGGNIATNAGGIKVLRYGLTRDWILGLTVVTGQGEILNLNQGLIKNATGYDLRHLMIGSEGTLGFITEATIKLATKPPTLKVMILGVPDLDSIMKVFAELKSQVVLTAFEFFSEAALKIVIEKTGLTRPFTTATEYYVLIEFEAENDLSLEKAMTSFEKCVERGWSLDGAIAQSDQQAKNFWRLREDISESLSSFSPYKNDISVQISKVPDFMRDLDGILTTHYPDWRVIWFGHIGDGNLHINILRPDGMSKENFVNECQKVDQQVFNVIQKYHGAISAEHGVGLTKKMFLNYSRSETEIEIMRAIKKIFDPAGIINPGKLL